MNNFIISNCRLVSPGVDIEKAYILIENGKVAQVSASPIAREGVAVIDGTGMTAMPGFVDVHCHGRNNFDFCDGSEEGVEVMAKNKLAEGVTTLLPTTLTLPEEELAAALRSIASYKQQYCKIPGVHLEGPFINPKCTGAQNPAFVRKPDIEEVKRLNAIFPVKKITFAVEEEGGADLVGELLSMGITPSCTHSAAKYPEFMAAYNNGLRNLSHFCNQMSPLHHRDIGLVGAGLLHSDVYAELICDKLHISPAMIQLVFKVKGPEHVVLITDAMRAAGMPDGEYSLGGLPVIVSEGAARLKEGGALAGSTLQLAVAVKNISEVTGLPLKELVKSSSLSAANALGLQGIGKIEPGYAADIVLLDKDFNCKVTMVDGEVRYDAR